VSLESKADFAGVAVSPRALNGKSYSTVTDAMGRGALDRDGPGNLHGPGDDGRLHRGAEATPPHSGTKIAATNLAGSQKIYSAPQV